MIIQTGMRTDIPAFYSEWLCNRIKEGYVMVRNPYQPQQVTRYTFSPSVVDLIAFCSKNPAPMLSHMDLLKTYGMYWFVTITPYGKEIEPLVPDVETVIDTFRQLAEITGPDSMGWRYDPIFLNETYTPEVHIQKFTQIAQALEGYTHTCVISFIDLYQKVRRNFPEAQATKRKTSVTWENHDTDSRGTWNESISLWRRNRISLLWGRLQWLYDTGNIRKSPPYHAGYTEKAATTERMCLFYGK